MEEYHFLIDIVSSLVEKGYSLNFSDFEEALKDFNGGKNTKISPKDFKIDRIYRCKESVYDSCHILVFAVSSSRFKFKCILINAIEEQSGRPVIERIKSMFNVMKDKILHRKFPLF